MVYEFDLEMVGISDPVIKRKFFISGNYSFMAFHYALQVLFNWRSYHYFCFSPEMEPKKWRIGDPRYDEPFDSEETIVDARIVKIKEIFTKDCKEYFYTYDYGDDWKVKITLCHRHSKRYQDRGMYCESAVGKAPPEDCGGVPGFQDFKNFFVGEPVEDPEIDYGEWLGLEPGEIWDPFEVDVGVINEELIRMMRIFFEEIERKPR